MRKTYIEDMVSKDKGHRHSIRWLGAHTQAGRTFEQAENDLRNDWEQTKGNTRLGWGQAKLAARDAWDRVSDLGKNRED